MGFPKLTELATTFADDAGVRFLAIMRWICPAYNLICTAP